MAWGPDILSPFNLDILHEIFSDIWGHSLWMRYFHIFLSLYWTWFGDVHVLMTGMYLGNGRRWKLIDL